MSGNKKMVNGWNPEESLLQQLTEHIVRVNVGAQTLLAHLFQFLNNEKNVAILFVLFVVL